MKSLAQGADLLDQAYRTAFFLHRDRTKALDIAARALSRLEVAATSQDRRLRYEPRRPRGGRNRISYGERHLLQQLVFAESEPYERRRERDDEAPLSETEGVVFFVKHLVRIGARRNSFYTTLGLARVLHDYATSEARALYEAVVQDPDRVKEDDYWRAAKRRLLHELQSRFGERLRLLRTSSGEERFATVGRPERLAATVEEALHVFTPSDTACPVPQRFDPREDEVPDLASTDPSDEQEVELRRVHAVVHPPCWHRLAVAVGLEPPAAHLSVPDLGAAREPDEGAGPGAWRSAAGAALVPDDREALTESLLAEAGRRRAMLPRRLLVKVDGETRQSWSVDGEARVDLRVPADAMWLDVVALQGAREVPLLSCALPPDLDESGPLRRSIVAEGGQRLTVSAAAAHGSWRVELSFAETRLVRRVRRAVRRAASPAVWFAPAVAAAAAAVFAGVLLWRGADLRDPRAALPVAPAETAVPARPAESPAPRSARPTAPDAPPSPPRLRAHDAGPGAVPSLAAVEVLVLEVRGGRPSATGVALRSALARHLEAGGRFRVTENADEADAALKVTIAGSDVSVRCVARDGTTLWPAGHDLSERGPIEDVASRIARRLGEAAGRPGAREQLPLKGEPRPVER